MTPIANFQTVVLTQLSTISYTYSLSAPLDTTTSPILLIHFSGVYRSGSSGNDDGTYMAAVAAAGIEAWGPKNLIFDLRELEYKTGDRLQNIFLLGRNKLCSLDSVLAGLASEVTIQDIPIFVITSNTCEAGIKSLIYDEMRHHAQISIVGTLEEAIKLISVQRLL